MPHRRKERNLTQADNANDAAYQVLERRATLRRILISGPRLETQDEIIQELMKHDYPTYSKTTLIADLSAIGGRQEHDEHGPYWTAGMSHNSPMHYAVDEEKHLSELQRVLRGHVLEANVVGPVIFFKCVPLAGSLVGYWLHILNWREIAGVLDSSHTVAVWCIGHKQAQWVLSRLYGQPTRGEPAPRRTSESMLLNHTMFDFGDDDEEEE